MAVRMTAEASLVTPGSFDSEKTVVPKFTNRNKQFEPGGGALPPTIKTHKYDGKGNWKAFHAQFVKCLPNLIGGPLERKVSS